MNMTQEGAFNTDPNPRPDSAVLWQFLDLAKGQSVREIAKATGLSVGTISRIRGGRWEGIHPRTLRKISKYVADTVASRAEERYRRVAERDARQSALDQEFVARLMSELNGISAEDLAELLDGEVSAEDVQRWQRQEWKENERLSNRAGSLIFDMITPTPGAFHNPVAFREVLASIGKPGEQKARKQDALEGLWKFFAAAGPVPSWWYVLRDQVTAGQI